MKAGWDLNKKEERRHGEIMNKSPEASINVACVQEESREYMLGPVVTCVSHSPELWLADQHKPVEARFREA